MIKNSGLYKYLCLILFLQSPFFLYFVYEIRCYSLLLLLSAILIYCVVKYEKFKELSTWDYVAFAFAYTLGGLTHLFFFLFLFVVTCYFLYSSIKTKTFRNIVYLVIIPNSVLLLLITLSVVFNHSMVVPQLHVILNIFNARANVEKAVLSTGQLKFFADMLFLNSALAQQISCAVFAYICLLLCFLKRKDYFILLLLVFIFFTPVVVLLGSIHLLYPQKYLSYLFPVLVLMLSYSLDLVFYNSLTKKYLAHLLVFFEKYFVYLTVLLFSFSVSLTVLKLVVGFKESTNCFVPLIKSIQLNDKNALLLVSPPWDEHVAKYYLTKADTLTVKGLNTKFDPEGHGIDIYTSLKYSWLINVEETNVDNIRNYVQGYSKVYYLNSAQYVSDPHGVAKNWLLQNSTRHKQESLPCGGEGEAYFYSFVMK